MSLNSNISNLDANQCLQRAFDGSNDSFRVEVGSGTSFSITIDGINENDSSLSVGSTDGTINGTRKIIQVDSEGRILPGSNYQINQKVSVNSASSTTVIAATSVVGMKTFNLFTNTTSNITGGQVCTLEVSPSDTDNVWKATTLTITADATAGVVVMSTPLSTIARRIRVTMPSTISSGAFDLYFIAQAN